MGDEELHMREMITTVIKDVNDVQATLFPININQFTADDVGDEIEVTMDGYTWKDTIVRANFPLVGEVFGPEKILLRHTAVESMREMMDMMTKHCDTIQAQMEGDETND